MKRVITAAIALPVLFASILIPQLWFVFVALAAVAIALGLYEFYRLAQKAGLQPDTVVGFSSAAAIFLFFYYEYAGYLPYIAFLLPVLAIATLVAYTLRGAPFDKMLGSAAATFLGVIYVAFLGGHLVGLRVWSPEEVAAGRVELRSHVLLFFFLVIMASDIAAYYVGRAIGRHKLAPGISPGKTWEGAIAGMIASLATAAMVRHFFFTCAGFIEGRCVGAGGQPKYLMSLTAALILAAVMNVLGVLGDLTESAFKRGAGAKDAAQTLPGHGGVLDRMDSLLFNAPVIYFFFLIYFASQ